MFERFTEKARRVIFFARYEASTFGSPQIELEHLLLGLYRESKDLFSVPSAGKVIETVRTELARAGAGKPSVPTSLDLPLSDPSKRALAFAAEESERLAQTSIDCRHLALGMLREKDSVAARSLLAAGLTPEALRMQAEEAQGSATAAPVAIRVEPSRAPVNLPLSPASLHAIADALGEAQQEGRAWIEPRDLVLGAFSQDHGRMVNIFAELGINAGSLLERLRKP